MTSSTSRWWLDSATSIAVTIPPAWAIAVATCPTTAWSGAVCRRIVIEYDEVVALLSAWARAQPRGRRGLRASSGRTVAAQRPGGRAGPWRTGRPSSPSRPSSRAARPGPRPEGAAGRRRSPGWSRGGSAPRRWGELVPPVHARPLGLPLGRVVVELDARRLVVPHPLGERRREPWPSTSIPLIRHTQWSPRPSMPRTNGVNRATRSGSTSASQIGCRPNGTTASAVVVAEKMATVSRPAPSRCPR